MIFVARLDPARARRTLLPFPEHCACLEHIHEVIRCEKCLAAMTCSGAGEDDRLAGRNAARSMHNRHSVYAEPFQRSSCYLFERTLRQDRMVFKYEFRDRAIFFAGQTHEAHNAASFSRFASECCQLRRGIEPSMLNDCAHHPPETTGMNSTERSGFTIAPSAVIMPSTQARTR